MAPQRTDSVAALFGAAAGAGAPAGTETAGGAGLGGAAAPSPSLERAIRENMEELGWAGEEARYRREYARTVRMAGEEGFCVQYAALKEHKSANDLIMEWIRPHLEEVWPEAAPLYRPGPARRG